MPAVFRKGTGNEGQMDNRDKQEISNNIEKLDCLTGTGVTGNQGISLADELFVFISSGGSGREALIDIKKTLKKKANESELKEKTLFIAIDSDWNEQDSAVRKGDLDPVEAIKLPYAGVHRLINPDRITPQMKKWVHPDLWKATGGKDADLTPPDCLGGKGAGSVRQCGRLLFCQENAQAIYRNSLYRIKNKLKAGENRKIRVFFLAGLAGGTGSGTIIDLAYLTRHYLRELPGSEYSDISFYGYLLLPSACGNKVTDIQTGNRNAYAALKEIDHYMTVAERKDHMTVAEHKECSVMDYGFAPLQNVDIGENLFDFCTLVENVAADGLKTGNDAKSKAKGSPFGSNAGSEAKGEQSGSDAASVRGVITDSIISILCGERQYFDSRAVKPGDDLPSDANYIYNVLGVSSCVVPRDLMTSYVVKKVLDALFKKLRKASAVTDDRATDFIKKCGLGIKFLFLIRKTDEPEVVKKKIAEQVNSEFDAYGPYYVVSLIRRAAELIENDPFDYLHAIRQKKKSFFTNPFDLMNAKLNAEISRYEAAIEYFKELNRELYEVYAYVLDELRKQIGKNAGVLTEKDKYEKVFGENGRWTPIDLTPGDNKTEAVEKYLESFCKKGEDERLADELIGILCARNGNLSGRIDASERIREFVKKHLEKCIETTPEQLLVIAFSGEQNVMLSELIADDTHVPTAETYLAADALLEKLGDHVYTTAAMEAGFPIEAQCADYLILPEHFVWLRRAIEEKCGNYGIQSGNIYDSSEEDRAVLIRRYFNVPAWALNWTYRAEEDYKAGGADRMGLHIDQGENSDCSMFPDLYPEGKWKKASE